MKYAVALQKLFLFFFPSFNFFICFIRNQSSSENVEPILMIFSEIIFQRIDDTFSINHNIVS